MPNTKGKPTRQVVDRRRKDFLTEAEMKRFLDATRDGRHGVRDYAMMLMAYFDRRLNLSLRESRGCTYFVRSGFQTRVGPTPFIISAGVDNNHVDAALREVIKEIERLREDTVDGDELIDARNQVVDAFLRSFQSGYEAAEQLKKLAVGRLDNNFFEICLEQVCNLSPQGLKDLARRYLRTCNLGIVAVGPAAELRRQLAGWGRLIETKHSH